jgi:signal transduction histidine kinase
MKNPEQLKQLVAELQLLLDTANHERTRLEHELIQEKEKSSEIQRLNAAVLSSFCHEIRTPVNGILSFSELLKDQDISVEEQQQFIEMIQTGCQSLVKAINSLLEFSSKRQAPDVKCQTSNAKRQI